MLDTRKHGSCGAPLSSTTPTDESCDRITPVSYSKTSEAEANQTIGATGTGFVPKASFVHHVRIVAGGGQQNRSRIKFCLAPGLVNSSVRGSTAARWNQDWRTQIGEDSTFHQLLEFNGQGWVEPALTPALPIYLLLDSPDKSHISVDWWFATKVPLETIRYGILDRSSDGFASLSIAAYAINEQ